MPLFGAVSAIAGDIGRLARLVNFGNIPPSVGLAAFEVGEVIGFYQRLAG